MGWYELAITTVMALVSVSGKEGKNRTSPKESTTVPLPPHIVFILADDLGFHDIGYHQSDVKTPNLDKLASMGVRLENYYVQPTCTPTRSQLLTGRYQIHTGLQHSIIWPSQDNGLPLRFPTVADRLKTRGYATHLIGKWHVGMSRQEYLPTHRGFDSFYGLLTGSGDHFSHMNCHRPRGKGFGKRYCGYDFWHNTDALYNVSGRYSTNLFTRRALNIIQNHKKTKPMFMYLSFQAVHAPLQAPVYFLDKYKHIKDKKRRTYAAMVTSMDAAVGKIKRALKRKGMWSNTVLIFSTDNGGQVRYGGSNWPLRGFKNTLWEGGIRGVAFVRSKLMKAKGIKSRALIHISDWFPTIIHLAGGNVDDLSLDGYNQWPTICCGRPSPRKEILHSIDPLYPRLGRALYNDTFDTSVRAALRVGDWKLLTGYPGNGSWVAPPNSRWKGRIEKRRRPRKNVYLYNIRKDQHERYDLSSKYPQKVRSMLRKLQAYNATSVPAVYPPPDVRSDPSLRGGAWGPWQV